MAQKLFISASPHIHRGDSVERNMYGVVIALIPALLASFMIFGIGALIVTATSVLSCLLFEWSITKYILGSKRNTITDGSAIVTGILLAFNLPSNLPLYVIIIGAFVAIGIGKMTFGGLGNNPFNPALVGRVFLLISFPAQMTSWPSTHQLLAYTDATTCATPLSIIKQAVNGDADALNRLPDVWNLFVGTHAGRIGEVSVFALLIGTSQYPLKGGKAVREDNNCRTCLRWQVGRYGTSEILLDSWSRHRAQQDTGIRPEKEFQESRQAQSAQAAHT